MTRPRRVVLATSNAGKMREIQVLLGPAWSVLLQSDCGVVSVEETGDTFVENALIKARHAARLTGLPAIADDSGIEVDALGGAPGVRSARFAGPAASDQENVALLLAKLVDVPDARRAARFRCAMVYVSSAEDPHPEIGEGVWEGRITRVPRGRDGFGYDPVFEDQADNRTAAELTADEKNRRSHRAKAWQALREKLNALE
jgi:XTP/dITP diphosphohydrolase